LFECEVIEEREVLQEAELSGQADSENDLGGFSETMYFIGLDVHKKWQYGHPAAISTSGRRG
jgi:hypothetical protein